jgi:Tir chaperone protein (CesT) family
MSSKKPADFLQSLAQVLNFDLGDPKSLATESSFEITIQGNPITLVFETRESRPSRVIFCASLGNTPESLRNHLATLFLEANHLWSATMDATVSMNCDTGEALMAHQLLTEGLTSEFFINEFLIFAEAYQQWKLLLADLYTPLAEGKGLPV